MHPPVSDRRDSGVSRTLSIDLVLGAALSLLAIAAFLPSLHGEFVNLDDPFYVTQNPWVQSGLTLDSIRYAVTSLGNLYWHPLTWLSHALDCTLFGLDPAGHHLTSLLLHAANAVLLFLVLRRLTGVLWPSFIAALLFAIHPLRVESVAWVAERKDVLSGFFSLLTVLAYARYVRSPEWKRYLLVAGIFAFALMSKPSAVVLPNGFQHGYLRTRPDDCAGEDDNSSRCQPAFRALNVPGGSRSR